MRRSLAALLSTLFSLPAAGSVLVILSVPPVSRAVPSFLLGPIREAARVPFDLVALLPPGSLAGRAFYGTYEPLVPVFGAGALAVHSALLSLPFLAVAIVIARRARGRRGSRAPAPPLGSCAP